MKRILAMVLVLLMLLSLTACKSGDYKEAMEIFESGDYTAALTMFEELGDYKDSAELAKECKYQNATAAFESGDYSAALVLFEELGDYPEKCTECRYLITAEKSVIWHIGMDYSSKFTSMDVEECSIDESGNYYTVKGRAFMSGLTLWTDSGNGELESTTVHDFPCYTDFSVVMVKDDSAETGFKVASWESGDCRAVIDENTDYVEALKDYIIKNGHYDPDGNRSFLEVKKGANLYYYLFAESDGISFWSFASYEDRYDGFSHSYECSFDADGGATFDTLTMEYEMWRGEIDLTGDFTIVEATGTIDYLAQDIGIDEKYFYDISEDAAMEYIADCHLDAIAFIEEVLVEAHIGVFVFEDLFKIGY